MTFIILISLVFILIMGYISLKRKYLKHYKYLEFAIEFTNRFVSLANYYLETYDKWSRTGNIDGNQYQWLTKNVDKMQANLGGFGIINYTAPFRAYNIPRYEVLINTLSKFREKIHESEITMSEDCLTRYIGTLENIIETDKKNLKNPFIWFKEGINLIVSLPFSVLNWFGIINNKTLTTVTGNTIYKIATGIIALFALISSIVTIIQGRTETLEFIKKLLDK